MSAVISLQGLTKRYGDRLAVDDLTLELRPGKVTGFLGPNGAGKSTTMRLVLGLDRPTAGTALVCGLPYHRMENPLRTVGALLDARAVHPGRSGHAHLTALARSNGIPVRRVGTPGTSPTGCARPGSPSSGSGRTSWRSPAPPSNASATSRTRPVSACTSCVPGMPHSSRSTRS